MCFNPAVILTAGIRTYQKAVQLMPARERVRGFAILHNLSSDFASDGLHSSDGLEHVVQQFNTAPLKRGRLAMGAPGQKESRCHGMQRS